jgi:bifunctional enzyme CysN/CysC
MVIWVVGLSGSGKTYFSQLLYSKLKNTYKNLFLIDGDSFRDVMNNDLGFCYDDREKNGWRLAKLSKWLDGQNIHVIASVLSNYPEQQIFNRENNENYYQIYLKADYDVVSKRDVKKIYKNQANIVGMDIPFNEPISSDRVIINNFKSVDAEKIIEEVIKDLRPRMS